MLEIFGWVVVVSLFGFMIVGATMLVVDTFIQWKRERESRKAWQRNTF